MGQLTIVVPPPTPRQKESQSLPNSKLVFMTFIWQNAGEAGDPSDTLEGP